MSNEQTLQAIKDGLDGWIGISDLDEAADSVLDALAARPSPARDKVLEEAARVADNMFGKDAGTWHRAAREGIAAAIRACKAQPPSTNVRDNGDSASKDGQSDNQEPPSTMGEDHIADAGKLVVQPIGMDEREKIAFQIRKAVADAQDAGGASVEEIADTAADAIIALSANL